MNHTILFNKNMQRNYSRAVVRTLYNWYGSSCALWNGTSFYSRTFLLRCVVRQGGVMSPILFALYVNDIIMKLENSKLGCYVGDIRNFIMPPPPLRNGGIIIDHWNDSHWWQGCHRPKGPMPVNTIHTQHMNTLFSSLCIYYILAIVQLPQNSGE